MRQYRVQLRSKTTARRQKVIHAVGIKSAEARQLAEQLDALQVPVSAQAMQETVVQALARFPESVPHLSLGKVAWVSIRTFPLFFWLFAMVLVALGWGVDALQWQLPPQQRMIPLSLTASLSPWLGVSGVLLLTSRRNDAWTQLEQAAPISPTTRLFAAAMLLAAVETVGALIVGCLVSLLDWKVFAPLLLSWFAPFLLSSGLSLLLSLRFGPRLAFAASLGLWVMELLSVRMARGWSPLLAPWAAGWWQPKLVSLLLGVLLLGGAMGILLRWQKRGGHAAKA